MRKEECLAGGRAVYTHEGLGISGYIIAIHPALCAITLLEISEKVD